MAKEPPCTRTRIWRLKSKAAGVATKRKGLAERASERTKKKSAARKRAALSKSGVTFQLQRKHRYSVSRLCRWRPEKLEYRLRRPPAAGRSSAARRRLARWYRDCHLRYWRTPRRWHRLPPRLRTTQ